MRPMIATFFALTGCVGGEAPADLQWYTTCGDPACSGYGGPFDGVPLCADQVEGEACAAEGEQCDPEDDCNALLVCAAADPKDQTGGCPISRRAHKTEVSYLDPEGLRAAAKEALDLRLATWRYRGEAGEQRRLGFVIDDAPGSPAVRPDGERVDLYGYTSLALAALQAQQAEIEALRAELAALRAEVEACR